MAHDDLADIRSLLDPRRPADAIAGYYGLYHDRARTQLAVHRDPAGRADGFLVACRTGQDLFRPVVTLRADDPEAAAGLFRAGLAPGRPFLAVLPEALVPTALRALQLTDLVRHRLYTLDPARFQPQVNVLVQAERTPDRLPVFVIRAAGGQTVARAGLAWKSPGFAEVTVFAEPATRQRGYGRSVLTALTGWLQENRLRPVCLVPDEDREALERAEAVGYFDTGDRFVTGQGVRPVG